MTKILTGGVGKVEVTDTIKQLAIDGIDIVASSDMDAAMKLRVGQADYYLGTCHTGSKRLPRRTRRPDGLGRLPHLRAQHPLRGRGRRPPRRRQEGLRILDGPDRRHRPLMARAIAARG